MRTSELELRSRLRFLQVARLEGWEVATQFLKATDGTTDDPAVIEARKAVAKNKKDRDEDNAPNKSRRTSSGRSPRDSKQWSRGRGQHQGTAYEQTAGYQFTGANAFTPPPLYYNFATPQNYYGHQGPATQWPSTFTQTPAPLPPQPLPPSSTGYRRPSQPPIAMASAAAGRDPPICFGCLLPGHIRQNCPDNNKPKL